MNLGGNTDQKSQAKSGGSDGETSQGVLSQDTPVKAESQQMLPPLASLTSPQSQSGSGLNTANASSAENSTGQANAPNWMGLGSLRSGPLSPAMLQAPSQVATPGGSNVLAFDPSAFRTGLTPNESGIRTGLTPGNPNSMFPAPSPTTAALLGFVNGTTPGNEEASRLGQPPVSDYFDHASSAAANGLFLLSQAQQQQQQQQQQQAANKAPHSGEGHHPLSQSHTIAEQQSQAQDAYQSTGKRSNRGRKPNGNSMVKRADSDDQIDQENSRPKRARRSTLKRSESNDDNNGTQDEDDSDTWSNDNSHARKESGSRGNMPPKKAKAETDDEKRRDFLERNRQAALKCRQRKKQWLANLQAKVEFYGNENDALSAQVTQLREEIVDLKTLLLAHRDCNVTRAGGGVGIDRGSVGPPNNQAAQFANMHGHPNGAFTGPAPDQSVHMRY